MADLDRMQERREIGVAVRTIEDAQRRWFAENNATKERLHAAWRDLLDRARAAERELDQFNRGVRHVAANERQFIRDAKRRWEDLRTFDHDPEGAVMTCALTGLALFDGDELVGDPEYGGGILRAAVTIAIDPVPGHTIEQPEQE